MTAPKLRSPYFDEVSAVLLDFDGPVTALMPAPMNRHVADQARAALAAHDTVPPEPVASTSDHLAVLRWAGEHLPAAVEDVETACVAAEVTAARTTPLTTGAHDLLHACRGAGVPVVVVSNNAASAVEVFLAAQGMADLVQEVLGRPLNQPELMKPHPHLVQRALAAASVDPASAVLVGDSVSDVVVAHAAGVRAIGFAKHERRGRELREAGADFIVTSMVDLTR